MDDPPALLERGLARILRPFAKVEPQEATVAVVMTFIVFLLLTAYYLLKTAREPLILLQGGAEVKSYAAAGQALLLLLSSGPSRRTSTALSRGSVSLRSSALGAPSAPWRERGSRRVLCRSVPKC